MKRNLFIDYDDSKQPFISMGLVKKYANEEIKIDPALDMAILCEAICMLIHVCHQNDIKKDADSLRDCIKHLKEGFIDETYRGILNTD